MKLPHRVNFDYDQALLKNDSNYRNIKSNRMFEYIYFLVNQDPSNKIVNCETYCSSYLEYLKESGFVIPEFSKSREYENWWADTSNLKLSKKIESKISTLEISKKYSLCPIEVDVVENEESLELYLNSNEKYYYRSEFGFSGTGNKVISPEKSYSLRYPGVIAPFYKKTFCFGVTVDTTTDSYYIIENFIDENGAFVGGRVSSEKEIAEHLRADIDLVREKIKKIIKCIKDHYGAINFQFDSFLYEENSSIKWYELVEVNYRKTMGHVVKSLSDKFGPGNWHIRKNTYSATSHKELEIELEKSISRNVIVTSPLNHKLISYFAY